MIFTFLPGCSSVFSVMFTFVFLPGLMTVRAGCAVTVLSEVLILWIIKSDFRRFECKIHVCGSCSWLIRPIRQKFRRIWLRELLQALRLKNLL